MNSTEQSDPYDKFVGYADGTPRFPSAYPFNKYVPLDPAFAKRGEVLSGGRNQRRTHVDLVLGECECPKGYAYMPDTIKQDGSWYANKYCSHKLRLMCSVVDNVSNPVEKAFLLRHYMKALSSRYNVWEVVSAYHKELRRGDFEAAWFWSLILSQQRGMRGVIIYLLNILYEETRDHDLAQFLLKLRRNPREHTLDRIAQATSWFCAAKKKWELPHRYDIFSSEMHGYEKLAKEFGSDVAKGGNFIPVKFKAKLLKAMQDGARLKKPVLFQYGLKGLQKLEFSEKAKPTKEDVNDHRHWLYERLYDIADELLPPTHDAWRVISVVNERIEADIGAGYHELNAIGDAIMGEPYDSGLLSPAQRAICINRPTPAIPLGKWPKIPLVAADNHTYLGKALMRRHPDQLKPGATQTDLDFRYCGAYFGVAFRMIAYRQHGRIPDNWSEVTWDRDLYRITQTLWY